MKIAAPIIAGIAVLALTSMAVAEEPIALTDAQLDAVTAGDAGGSVSLNVSSAFGLSNTSASAFISVDAVPFFQSASAAIGSTTTLFLGTVSVNQNASAFANTF